MGKHRELQCVPLLSFPSRWEISPRMGVRSDDEKTDMDWMQSKSKPFADLLFSPIFFGNSKERALIMDFRQIVFLFFFFVVSFLQKKYETDERSTSILFSTEELQSFMKLIVIGMERSIQMTYGDLMKTKKQVHMMGGNDVL